MKQSATPVRQQEAAEAQGAFAVLLRVLPIGLFLASRTSSFFTPLIARTNAVLLGGIGERAIFCIFLALECAVFFCLLAFALRKPQSAIFGHIFAHPVLYCVIGFLGLLLVYLSSIVPAGNNVLLILGLLLSAVYAPTVFLVVMGPLVDITLEEAAACLAAAGIVYAVVHMINAQYYSNDIVSYIIIAIPLIICLLELLKRRRLEPVSSQTQLTYTDRPLSYENNKLVFLHYVIALAFYVIGAAYTRMLSNPSTDVPTFERSITLTIVLVAFAFLYILLREVEFTERLSQSLFSLLSMFFVLSLLFTTIAVTQWQTEYGTAVIKASQRLFEIYLLLLGVFFIQRAGSQPIAVFCFYGITVLAIPNLLAHLVFTPFNAATGFSTSPYLVPTTSAIAIISLIAVFAIMMYDSRLANKRAASIPSVASSLERCEMVGKENGLTAREIEILNCLYQGYSVRKIADVMFIATTTVQGHSRSIYRKLDVHSKQELIDLINEKTGAPL